ncbi:protein eva-1 homolog C-like [Lycorma delicatula]|uniref:protein eva-1 homolog C-like n=1 Tax=Lycorma delicatula TaxID=130591 RepID=UPI003F510E1D
MKKNFLWLILIWLFLQFQLLCADNLALLSNTLRTYQVAACHDQIVTLRCPPGTCISVQLAQYGDSSPHLSSLCPNRSNASCPWQGILQYSLLQTVVEACQKKRSCRFQATPNPSCPGSRHYIEVAYKCRPYEFRGKVVCENEVLQLQCNPNSRLAIYSASYGRTEYESIRCPQPQGVREESCLVSYATETVMHFCHGKRRCTISADAATFGSPCQKESRTYLKVVYTCVPRKVLRIEFEDRPEEDEMFETEDDLGDYDSSEDIFLPNLSGGQVNQSEPPILIPSPDPPTRQQHGNQSKVTATIYLSVGASICLVLTTIVIVVIGRLIWRRYYRHENKHHPPKYQTETSMFTDITDDTPDTIISSQRRPLGEVVRYVTESNSPYVIRQIEKSDYYYYG